MNDKLLKWHSSGSFKIGSNPDEVREINDKQANSIIRECGRLAGRNLGGEELIELITSESSGLTPPGLSREQGFCLGCSRKSEPGHWPEGTEREMCRQYWGYCLDKRCDCGVAFGRSKLWVHSYEVPLVYADDNLAWEGFSVLQRFADLLATTDFGHPVVIEGKKVKLVKKGSPQISATAGLIDHFLQGLSYAVTLRYTWRHSSGFINEWKKALAALELVDGTVLDKLNTNSLTEVPVILAANPDYWTRNYHWGSNQEHWRNLKALVRVANESGYPIFAGRLSEPASHDEKWQFEVTSWDSLPDPSADNQISFPGDTPNSQPI